MLRACRKVLRPGGRLAFLTIQPTPGLEPSPRRKANRVGPSAVATRTSYESLLHSAGFIDIGATDMTTEYRSTQQRWIDATNRHADAISAAMGAEVFDDREAMRQQTLQAINDGLLSRFLYTAVR